MTATNEISLPPTLVIRDVRAMRSALLDAIGASVSRIDASQLTQIDTAGLQLLVATVAAMRGHGLQPQWANVRVELADAAVQADFVAALGLPKAA